MSSRPAPLLLVALVAGCVPAPARTAPAPLTYADPVAVVAEADRLAARELWPGFDPRRIPVAIFDGERTLLFRHPNPPAEFSPLSGQSGAYVFAGRHGSLVANTSVEMGGVLTATLIPPAEPSSLRVRASVVIHEAFHVHQRTNHPGWIANEAELFTYPVDDTRLLALRRLESEALRRALEARREVEAACWAHSAVALRSERFSAMSSGAAQYERMTELNEGLASYVQRLASGDEDDVLPDTEFAADAVRARAYRSGAGIALLLDRLSPGWQLRLTQNDTLALDTLLADAVPPAARLGSCVFDSADRARVQAAAESDIRALNARRAAQRQRVLGEAGWRLVIEAPNAPLFPQGFDPLNVSVVAPGEVVHSRFVRLGNAAGTVEVMGRASLSEAAGAHPLFNGVARLTITGLPARPALTVETGQVSIEADGVRAVLRGAVEETGQAIVVRITSGD